MVYALLLLLWLPVSIVTEDLSEPQKCLFRCTASCLTQQKNHTVQRCLTECKAYDNPQPCNLTDENCWDVCKNLSSATPLKAVNEYELRLENLTTVLVFNPIEEVTFYLVQYQSEANLSSPVYEISMQPFIINQMRPKPIFCDPVMIRVAAVSPAGTGPFSKPFSLDAPRPIFNPRLELLTMAYLDVPYESGSYFDNGTLQVIFKYKVGACDNVRNSPCMHTPPTCGRIAGIHLQVAKEYTVPGEREVSLSLDITFDPIVRKDEPPTIYYMAFYGEASPYPRQAEEALAGVNITRIIGNSTNCLKFDHRGYCMKNSNNSISISGIHYDKTYGITFCAIKDPRNLMVPNLVGDSMVLKPRASKVYVTSKDRINVAVIIAIFGGAATFVIVFMAVCCYISWNEKKQKTYQL